jgi:hypothetical protein
VAKLASFVNGCALLLFCLMTGCSVKTFSSQQEFMKVAAQTLTDLGGFTEISCPPQAIDFHDKDGSRACFATRQEPTQFVDGLTEKLKAYSAVYGPWSEDNGSTHGSFKSLDGKYQIGFTYAPTSGRWYFKAKNEPDDLENYQPLKTFRAYLSVIVEDYQQ